MSTLVLTMTGAALLTACGSSGDGGGSSPGPTHAANSALHDMLPASVQKSGTLTVATDASYPPFEFYESDNKTLGGADIELAKALGSQLGVTFKLQNTAFDGIVPGLAADKFDLAMSGIADIAVRQKQVSFVDYATNGDAFLTLKADASKYPSWKSLCGINVAVQSGTDMVDDLHKKTKECTDAGKSAITISDYQTQTQSVLAVTSGRSKVLVSTGGSATYIAKQSNGQLAAIVPPDNPPGTFGTLGIALPKDQQQLAQALQAAVNELIKDGTYTKIMDKWGLTGCCTLDKATINHAVG